MKPWQRFSTTVLGITVGVGLFVLATAPVQAADDCGSSEYDATSAPPEYVQGPVEAYTLEQPFGGKASVKDIGEYIQLVYSFALGIMGIIAVVLIMFGGIRWIAAAGNESVISEAKEIIISAVTGLVIGLLSYVILAFINPQTLSTDVSIFKIPVPISCSYPDPESKPIPTGNGLNGNGKSLCIGGVDELVRIADYMINGDDGEGGNAGPCPTCTIGVSSGLRTHEQQQELRSCYERALANGVSDGSSCPAGCSGCNLAAKVCCSEHEHGQAVDLWLEGFPESLGLASSQGYAKTSNNNGAAGGPVNYSNCSGTPNPALCNNQLALKSIMELAPSSQFDGISQEWWHFDFKGSCAADLAYSIGTSTGTCEVADDTGMAANYVCSAGGVMGYAYAICDGNNVGCSSDLRADQWFISSKCAPGSTHVSFADQTAQSFSGDFPDYADDPTCVAN